MSPENTGNGSGKPDNGPLQGIRVLELGQLIAGPYAGSVLAYFGAEVIKIESPRGGDPLRRWRQMHGENSFWWYSLARNKKSVTLDLNQEEGRQILEQLVPHVDVVIENFRPGVLEKWGLGPERLKTLNPGVQIARISGYGQDGPLAHKPGFASVCEGFSGFRYVNGYEGEAPVRPNLSIGDTIAGMHAVMGILMGLLHRERQEKRDDSAGQVIDVSLFESMFSLMEAVIPEYTGAGVVRQPSGTTVTGIVPTNTYRCADGKYLIIGGNGDSIFKRLMTAIGREEMANDPELADNPGRVLHEERIDKVLASWCEKRPVEDAMQVLEAARVPAGPIYSAEDMVDDEQYAARNTLEPVSVDGVNFSIPAYGPKFERTPGSTCWVGPQLGEHNSEIYEQMLGIPETQLCALREKQVI